MALKEGGAEVLRPQWKVDRRSKRNKVYVKTIPVNLILGSFASIIQRTTSNDRRIAQSYR